ncbi:uncharacterized protein LOC118646931 [Monomorium pharaonis]|uniref:uncharacterized protein LOC118646931 n=1 Tax=Monomorium pharaonis TaxID=307658 RepID=UPI001745D116|nr:uncharacterized protein LOC118646931 [Monomorium pharaonis]
MEAARKKRMTNRTAFTRAINDLATTLTGTATRPTDKEEIFVYLQVLEERHEKLRQANDVLIKCMHETEDVTDEAIAIEDATNDEYERKFIRARLAAMNALGTPIVTAPNANETINDGANTRVRAQVSAQTSQIKLPKIELKRYDGDIKEWLRFWSQFKKIHENATIDKETKFQYFLQTVVPDSRAAELIGSFPPTDENYDKAIAAMKNRFGRDEMLVEVYVRELLKLVLQNAMKPNEKIKLASLFDKIESQLRALESLGVTTDRCGAMLYPLVESSLPEELLRAWQRNQVTPSAPQRMEYTAEPPPREDRLMRLMKFLQSEVENEERITIAVNGFDMNDRKQSKHKQRLELTKDTPFAMSLHASGKPTKIVCVFCEGEHASPKCEKARKMILSDRKSMLQTKNACFNCLRIGHQSRTCRGNLKCAFCSRHVVLMCPEVMGDSNATTSHKADESVVKDEKSLFSHTRKPKVILQILRMIIRNKQEKRVVKQPWINELKVLGIQLTEESGESDHAQPIKILIGADIAGKLLTGKTRQLRPVFDASSKMLRALPGILCDRESVVGSGISIGGSGQLSRATATEINKEE